MTGLKGDWYVMFGKGRVLGTSSAPPSGQTLRAFPDEDAAVSFAKKCVKDGLNVMVGPLGSEASPKYRTADIARLLSS